MNNRHYTYDVFSVFAQSNNNRFFGYSTELLVLNFSWTHLYLRTNIFFFMSLINKVTIDNFQQYLKKFLADTIIAEKFDMVIPIMRKGFFLLETLFPDIENLRFFC
ncbi:MAG: hypothetical protein FWH37_07020 [Candidatus Bathyarchaeota archaeon]|nr:hypothetical protein [Candidatus Termiticorpusculum sp.]